VTKKPPRRSIVASFSALAPGPAPQAGAALEQKAGFMPPTSGLIPARVAAGVVGATQRTLTDIREERDWLRAELAAGGAAALDPAVVDPSPFADRLPDDDAAAFEQFKASVSAEGQKVPAEVRRNPGAPGRFQLVYGHRRWRAARELGIPLRAIVVDVDDAALAIAQGVENAQRQDLSWIEKALFAARMDAASLRARDIRAALGVDDPEIARFRQVCRTLGIDLIHAIGRAPRVGRPRWMELAAQLGESPALREQLSKTLAAAKGVPSDERFAVCITAICAPAPQPPELALRGAAGEAFGKVSFSASGLKLQVAKREAEPFLAFFRKELPGLMERFLAEKPRS
jgi:ParB family transcriptional regulator, chromosome partitioning protein